MKNEVIKQQRAELKGIKVIENPQTIVKQVQTSNISDCIKLRVPTIRQLVKRGMSKQLIFDVVRLQVLAYLRTFASFDLEKNEFVVNETARLICQQFAGLNFAEVSLFFDYCKTARYGKLFGISTDGIFDMLRAFQIELNTIKYKEA